MRVLTLEKNRGKGGAVRLVCAFTHMENIDIFIYMFIRLNWNFPAAVKLILSGLPWNKRKNDPIRQ